MLLEWWHVYSLWSAHHRTCRDLNVESQWRDAFFRSPPKHSGQNLTSVSNLFWSITLNCTGSTPKCHFFADVWVFYKKCRHFYIVESVWGSAHPCHFFFFFWACNFPAKCHHISSGETSDFFLVNNLWIEPRGAADTKRCTLFMFRGYSPKWR